MIGFDKKPALGKSTLKLDGKDVLKDQLYSIFSISQTRLTLEVHQLDNNKTAVQATVT